MAHLLSTLWHAANGWIDDRAPRIGAALAFYTALSLSPMLIVSLALAGRIYGAEAAKEKIVERIEKSAGPELAATVERVLENTRTLEQNGLALVVGLVTIFLGATGVFGELQDGLNDVWKVRRKSGRPVWSFLRSRFLSFAMVLGVGFLVAMWIAMSIGLDFIGRYTVGLLPGASVLLSGTNFLIAFAIEALLFAAIFKILPDAHVHWRDVLTGALVTSGLFTLGKYLIHLYLVYGGIGSVYGTAGSVVVFLVWTYYSSQILLFGAEVTKVVAHRAGRGVEPKEGAEASGVASAPRG